MKPSKKVIWLYSIRTKIAKIDLLPVQTQFFEGGSADAL